MPNTLLPRIAARLSAPDDPPDSALLGRFAADRDADAFALLVARHGPMVLAVCRRVLGNAPDADDAFQAAFLVLVRRAGEVQRRDRLTGWLYVVAYRTATEARRLRARRVSRETPTGEVPDVPAEPAAPDADLPAIVERELAALPDHYRLAVALCDLDGRSRADVAVALGIPEGTLSSRLNAGRKLLASRLARCGYGLAAVGAAGGSATAIPGPLVDAAVRTAVGTASPDIASVTEGVLHTMSTKRKLLGWAVACLFVAGAVGTTAVLAGGTTSPRPDDGKLIARKVNENKDDAGAKKVADAPPVVVKTVPAAGSENVDPGLKEVSVTFSKAMTDGSWTWATDQGRGAALPSGDNKPAFDKDKKTCTLAVKLEPDTTYAVWLNGGRFMSFVDADGTPSLPYLLVFRTGKAK
ncbi:MAG: sigma-70 family RNA polymerase sigma factor [Gemmataceae bacterium]